MNYNLVIVDDHTMVASALAGIINSFPNYTVLYEVEHGKALMEKFNAARNIPDVVLLDIAMPVMDGFETAAWIKKHHPELLVIALSMQNDDTSLIKMVRAGAKGYLLKNNTPEQLLTALNELTSKGYYFPDWAANKILKSLGEDLMNKVPNTLFTDREVAFLRYCPTEMTYKEIAEKMFCSPRTVEGYRDALFEKLDLKTRVGLAVFALKSGFEPIEN